MSGFFMASAGFSVNRSGTEFIFKRATAPPRCARLVRVAPHRQVTTGMSAAAWEVAMAFRARSGLVPLLRWLL